MFSLLSVAVITACNYNDPDHPDDPEISRPGLSNIMLEILQIHQQRQLNRELRHNYEEQQQQVNLKDEKSFRLIHKIVEN